jgi:Tol biopolymer transport system component
VANRTLIAVSLLIAVLATACGDGDGETGENNAASGEGVLVFSRADGIYELALDTLELKSILKPQEPNSFVLDPAVSPDGGRIAYVVQPPAAVVDGRYDAGSDLWIADRDGGNARLLYKHEDLNALVRFPQWAGDGHILAFVQDIEVAGTPEAPGLTDIDYTVQRFDAETGAREQVLGDAIAFTLSPDGIRIAYSRFDPAIGEIFEAVPLAGGEPQVLVAREENLNPYNSPRYSPDGAQIAFASAEQPLPQTPPTGRLFAPLPRPWADGFPQDIWLVDAAGGRPRMLADLKEDLPSLAWTDDGSRIYVLGANGLYEIEVASGAVIRLGEGVFHATVDWTPD